MKSQSLTIQMKAAEHFFSVVLFIMVYKVVLTFAFVTNQMKAIDQLLFVFALTV